MFPYLRGHRESDGSSNRGISQMLGIHDEATLREPSAQNHLGDILLGQPDGSAFELAASGILPL